MNLDGACVAVTGASGFCGSAVAVALAGAGAQVLCFGRRPGPVGAHIFWDATAGRPDFGRADAVIHLAAAVGDQLDRRTGNFQAVNVDATARLLDAAGPRKVVMVSSASVYNHQLIRGPIREDHPVGGQLSAYGRTKAAGEGLALAAGAVVLRPRAVYGPGDPHLLPRLRSRVRFGQLFLPGPDRRLSLTAVGNLAEACLAALDWPPGPYNISDAEPYWRDSAIRTVFAAAGQRVRVQHIPMWTARTVAVAAEAVAAWQPSGQPMLSRYAVDQLCREVVLDITRARAQGWHPTATLQHPLGG